MVVDRQHLFGFARRVQPPGVVDDEVQSLRLSSRLKSSLTQLLAAAG